MNYQDSCLFDRITCIGACKMKSYKFEELKEAPLVIDAIYQSGSAKNIKDEPFHVLLPRTSNQGGFRITHRQDNMKLPAYVVIYTSFEEIEWPDYLDSESGIFRFYGDNRNPGNELHSTRKKGNLLLRDVFNWLNTETEWDNIPPFLIFKKTGEARNVQFLGLAAPGSNQIPPDRDLISFWRTSDGMRFQNYEAYFTILDTKDEDISKKWLEALIYDHANSLELAPKAWKNFIKKGRPGIRPLKAPKISVVPSKKEQLPCDEMGENILKTIREHYVDNPYGFEKCAIALVQLMDPNFYHFDLTRPWRDGGRDAVGKYKIGMYNNHLSIDCALEAKCYSVNNSIGVRQMSRLISRIKYRQFGVMVTTSFVDKQAYTEILEDGHPILIITSRDIAQILQSNGLTSTALIAWLKALDLDS